MKLIKCINEKNCLTDRKWCYLCKYMYSSEFEDKRPFVLKEERIMTKETFIAKKMKCPVCGSNVNCGSGYFYYIYLMPEKDEDFYNLPEEYTFSIDFTFTLTASGFSKMFTPSPLKDYDIVR